MLHIGRYDILSQQIRQIQAYHRKTYCDFNVTLHSRKKHFCHTKLNNNYEGGSFQVLIFDSKLDILAKRYQVGTSYIKISIKITRYQLL